MRPKRGPIHARLAEAAILSHMRGPAHDLYAALH